MSSNMQELSAVWVLCWCYPISILYFPHFTFFAENSRQFERTTTNCSAWHSSLPDADFTCRWNSPRKSSGSEHSKTKWPTNGSSYSNQAFQDDILETQINANNVKQRGGSSTTKSNTFLHLSFSELMSSNLKQCIFIEVKSNQSSASAVHAISRSVGMYPPLGSQLFTTTVRAAWRSR